VPIFRDREELPAAGDLTSEVRAALEMSRSLIVVCSPSAAASKWVRREVEVFRELHPDRPVLAAIQDGEPSECFPDAMRSAGTGGIAMDPLAADFRRGRDGEQLGLLKLIAGVVGIGLDGLVQRDAHRRMQRVMAVTAGALIAVLVMGVLTAIALSARLEAERQRGEAEGLVEFMLTDLRDKLKGVGRLDIMTAVNERALHYYQDQKLERLSADSLERRARILHAMGADDEVRGHLAAALEKYQEANRTTAALLAEAPADPKRIYAQAQSEYGVALIAWRSYRFGAAQAGFERYAALARRLISISPANPDWQMEAGYAESNLATFMLRTKGDAARAIVHFERAQKYFITAQRAKPGDHDIADDIADGYAWLADCQRALHQFDDARANRAREAGVLGALLRSDPKNVQYSQDLLGNALGFAQIDMDQGNWSAAETRLAGAYADASRLAASDPENQKLAKQRIAIGLFLAKAGLHQDPPAVTRSHELLSDCQGPVAKGDQELKDFCAVVSVAVAKAAGEEDKDASEYLRRNRERLRRIRRSPRWGIDFHNE